MHVTSMLKMSAFRDAYIVDNRTVRPRILDVGSMSIDGADTYRMLFAPDRYEYVGLDLTPGPNVDLVPSDPYSWDEIPSESFDFVISGQSLEHNAFFWITCAEIARVLRPRGYAALVAPSAGVVHRFPLDCWRFYPDSWAALADYCGLSLVEHAVESDRPALIDGAEWADSVAILTKSDFASDSQQADFYDRLQRIVATRGPVPNPGPVEQLGPALVGYEALIGSPSADWPYPSGTGEARQWWRTARQAPGGVLVVEEPGARSGATLYAPLEVSGWVWPAEEGTEVLVEVDGQRTYPALLGIPRWDVRDAIGEPGVESGGFVCPLGSDVLPPGEHSLVITKTSLRRMPVTVRRTISTKAWADAEIGGPVPPVDHDGPERLRGNDLVSPGDPEFEDLLQSEVDLALHETTRNFQRAIYEHAVLRLRGRPIPRAVRGSRNLRALRPRTIVRRIRFAAARRIWPGGAEAP